MEELVSDGEIRAPRPFSNKVTMSGAKVKIGKHQTGIITRIGPSISRFSFQLQTLILVSSRSSRSSTPSSIHLLVVTSALGVACPSSLFLACAAPSRVSLRPSACGPFISLFRPSLPFFPPSLPLKARDLRVFSPSLERLAKPRSRAPFQPCSTVASTLEALPASRCY